MFKLDTTRAVLQQPDELRRRPHRQRERPCGDNARLHRHVRRTDVPVLPAEGPSLSPSSTTTSRFGAINPDSEMLWVRESRDPVAKLAPFLAFDGDPYPVVLDGGVSG